MDSSDSLQIDEHLARLLAAYDPGIEGGDGKAPTIGVSPLVGSQPLPPGEHRVEPLSGSSPNEGSARDLFPDSRQTPNVWTPQSPAPTAAPQTGPHRIGRFELRRQLGKGGCGIVFLAFDPKLEREVALKIPRPEMLLSPDARRRLVREALAAAEFDHPNLVPVYETGEIGPVCFIATAFCPGQTLGEWLDKQAYPVPVRQAARLVATIAEAVQHAHDRGVLHRDLKPNNVILQTTKDDPQEQEPPAGSCPLRGENYIPRVVDFGLAKLFERGGPSDTNTRQILGTPKYMAPEQAQARHDDVGPTADVYALGVILYELLTGRAPYEGASDVEVLRLAIEGNLTQPRHIRADLPRDLEAICLKAMAKSTGRRYRTAIDLSDDLRRFLDDKPTLARPLKWPGRAMRWLRRNDQVVALVVVTSIAAVLFAVGASYMRQTRQLKSDQDRAARAQAERTLLDQYREYAKIVRAAYMAWRGGEYKSAEDGLEEARRIANSSGESLDFPLRYLATIGKERRLHIVCPDGPVTALAVSADGKRLASGHADGMLALWDRNTGEKLGSVKAHETAVSQVAFARGGTRLLTVGQLVTGAESGLSWNVAPDGAVAPSAAPERSLGLQISCIAVSPDGEVIFAGSRNGALARVNLADARQNKAVPLTASDPIATIAVSQDGKRLLVGTKRGKVLECTLDLVQTSEREISGSVTALAPDPHGAYVVGTRDGILLNGVDAWFLPTGGRVHWALSAGERMIVPQMPGWLLVWSGRWQALPTGDTGEVRAAALTRDGNNLFTAGDDGIIRSWHLPGDLRERGAWSGAPVHAIAVEPDGRWFTVATRQQVTHEFGGKGERPVSGPGRLYEALTMKKEGTTLGVEFEKQNVILSELVSGPDSTEKWRYALPGESRPVSTQFSPDGGRLAVGDDRGQVFVFNTASGERVASIDCGHRNPIRRVALSDDGRLIAAPSAAGLGIWVVENASAGATEIADDSSVFRFIPGGSRIVTAGRSGAIRIWLVASGREEAALFGHVGRVTGLGASPDGRTLVSGGATGEVKFWDIRTSLELFGFRRHSGPVTTIEFAANGKLLVTGGNGQIAEWEVRD